MSEQPISRRKFLLAAVTAAGGALLAACAQPPVPTEQPAPVEEPKEVPKEQPTEAPKEAPPAEQVTLEWYTCFGTWGEPGLKPAVDDYQQKNPNITFAPLVYAMDSTQGALEGLLSRIAAGTPPDIALMWDSPVSLGVRGAATILDELMVNSVGSKLEYWPELVYRSCRFQGKSYGFPSFNAVYCMYYNTDAFTEKGIPTKREEFPKTWDELKAVSKQLTQFDGEKPSRVGYFPLWNFFTDMWLQFNGGGCFDWQNAKYHVDSEQNIFTLDYGAKWIDEEYKGNYDAVKGTGWNFWDDLGGEPAFQDGRMCMLQGGNFSLGMYEGENPPKVNWDVARFPQGPSSPKTHYSTYYGNWLLIPSGTKHLNEAFAFVDWFNYEGVMHWVSSGSADMPASKKFYDNNPNYVTPMVQKHLPDRAQDLQKFFEDQIAHAVDMFGSPVASFQWDQSARAAERVLKKADTAANALKEAQKACEAELQKILSGA